MNWLTFPWAFPFINGWIHYLIGYPPLYQLVEAFLRARGSPRARGPQPARARKKCFDQLIKWCLYWITHQIMDSTVDKRGNSWKSQSIHWDNQLIGFWIEIWSYYYYHYCFLYQKCKASWLSRPPGAKFDEKRNLRIQGRMQIFRKVSQKALNRVLTVPDYSTRRELSGTTLKTF